MHDRKLEQVTKEEFDEMDIQNKTLIEEPIISREELEEVINGLEPGQTCPPEVSLNFMVRAEGPRTFGYRDLKFVYHKFEEADGELIYVGNNKTTTKPSKFLKGVLVGLVALVSLGQAAPEPQPPKYEDSQLVAYEFVTRTPENGHIKIGSIQYYDTTGDGEWDVGEYVLHCYADDATLHKDFRLEVYDKTNEMLFRYDLGGNQTGILDPKAIGKPISEIEPVCPLIYNT